MVLRSVTLLILAALALGPVACTSPEPVDVSAPPSETPGGDPAGSRLAFGLHDLEDGSAQAVGLLEYQEIEGGFWAIVSELTADDDTSKIVAVIANGTGLHSELTPLEGKTVMATGKRLNGVSIRMAGPEIEVTEIVEVTDRSGPAE